MKTSIIFHVKHPDTIPPGRVAELLDKMVWIGNQEAHDSIDNDATDEFDGARDVIQLEPETAEICTVAGVSDFSVLKSLCELLYIAEGSDPHDFDEDTQRIFNEAQAARDAVADSCPDCQGREVLCNECGGCGYVPKESEPTKPLRVLCHVIGGVASLAYDPGIEHVIADADEGGPIDIPAGWEDLAEQLDVSTDEPEEDDDDDDDDSEFFVNYYTCPRCGEKWTDTYQSQCDDDCPKCGMRHISPEESEDA